MHLKYIKSCRVCKSDLNPILDLGAQYLQGAFVKGTVKPPLRMIPLELGFCDPAMNENACGLVQLMHSVPPEILYKKYWYRSGTNRTMTNHLTMLANEIRDRFKPSTILDIGCNDGTFLKAFPKFVDRVGIDPSDAALAIGDNITVINSCFPTSKKLGGPFDVISSFAMLYDLDDPLEFLRGVAKALARGGVFVFEVAYLPTMMKNVAFDNICHEHLEYYSFAVLENMLAKVGMRIFDVRLTDTNCGSILCFADGGYERKDFNSFTISKLREKEFEMALDSEQTYSIFSSEVLKRIGEVRSIVERLVTSGKTVHIYGSSTKGNVLIQACGLQRWIEFAADRNPEKHGAETLGTEIKIISEEESRAMKPGYYLVLPWHFKNEFLEREKEAREAGTKFIFPFPTLEVL